MTATTPSLGLGDPAADERRRADLRRMRLVATGLLVVAAIVYVLTRGRDGFLGFVNAGAEASMVGACADWFAVTALFRHPLGIPIPHTALIPKRKDEIGKSLEDFVGENFMHEEVIRERVLDTQVARRAAAWVLEDRNSRRVVNELSAVTVHGLHRIPDADVQAIIEQAVLPRLKEEQVSPLLGGLLGAVVEDKAHAGLVDLGLDEAIRWLRKNPETFNNLIIERAPTWMPRGVNDLVAMRVHSEALKWLIDIRHDEAHSVRRALDDLLADLARDMQHDEATMERAERMKVRVLEHPQVLASAMSLWRSARAVLIGALEDEEGPVRARLEDELRRLATLLLEDDALRARVDNRIADAVVFGVQRYGTEITQVISQTVDRWDGVETANKVELMVGRDLQFIRINGTVVGGLIGVLIHAATLLLG